MSTRSIPNRTFGVELEVAGISQEQAFLVLRLAGVNVEDPYRHGDREDTAKWRFHDDGSIEDRRNDNGRGRRTCEVVSPILTGLDGLKQVRKVCQALTKAGAYVNDSCGLHIHVGARDLTAKEVYMICKRYADHETFIDSVMHPSRRANENEFCGSMKDTMAQLDLDRVKASYQAEVERYQTALSQIGRNCHSCNPSGGTTGYTSNPSCRYCGDRRRQYERVISDYQGRIANVANGWASVTAMVEAACERYRNVNLTAFTRHGTLEFRQHNGSIDAKKVGNWIRFVLNFVERSRAMSGEKRVKIKDPRTRIQARKKVYAALKEAGEAGLTKDQIIALTDGAWTMVRSNIRRMNEKHGLSIQEFRQNGILRWKMVLPTPGPNPVYRDQGPLMGLPKYVKSYFADRSRIDTDAFEAWA